MTSASSSLGRSSQASGRLSRALSRAQAVGSSPKWGPRAHRFLSPVEAPHPLPPVHAPSAPVGYCSSCRQSSPPAATATDPDDDGWTRRPRQRPLPRQLGLGGRSGVHGGPPAARRGWCCGTARHLAPLRPVSAPRRRRPARGAFPLTSSSRAGPRPSPPFKSDRFASDNSLTGAAATVQLPCAAAAAVAAAGATPACDDGTPRVRLPTPRRRRVVLVLLVPFALRAEPPLRLDDSDSDIVHWRYLGWVGGR